MITEQTSTTLELVADSDALRVTKRYTIPADDYIVQSEINVQNKSNENILQKVSLKAFRVDSSRLDIDPKKDRDSSLLEYVVNSSEGIARKNKAFKFKDKEYDSKEGSVNWVGYRDRYFCAIVKPQFDTQGYVITPVGGEKEKSILDIAITGTSLEIPAGTQKSLSGVVYFGPEDINTLKDYDMQFEDIKKFYKNGLLDGVAKIIYHMLHFSQKFVKNWGVAIILISFVVYFSVYPLTAKGMKSMRRMQELQPKIVELREKHKSNPQKLNKETMELYKKHKINPLGGCLPLLIQMPIFIGMYQVLWRDVSFKGANFLWIDDLSQPDQLFNFPTQLPFVGNQFNLLPILMIGIMVLQQKFSSRNIKVTDPQQLAQQKMMMTIMPVFLGFIFYKMASGLTLYFTMFYIFSTFTQWKMSKQKTV